MIPTRIRPWTEGDRKYVHLTWSKSAAPRSPSYWYWAAQHALMDVLTERGEVRVLCSTDYPSLILSWACIEGECVHWVYTRTGHRGLGHARELTSECKTTSAGKVRVDWLKYNPELLK